MYDNQGKVCLVGGVWSVVLGYEAVVTGQALSNTKRADPLLLMAEIALKKAVDERLTGSHDNYILHDISLVDYNDDFDRTYEEIDSLLAEAKGYC